MSGRDGQATKPAFGSKASLRIAAAVLVPSAIAMYLIGPLRLAEMMSQPRTERLFMTGICAALLLLGVFAILRASRAVAFFLVPGLSGLGASLVGNTVVAWMNPALTLEERGSWFNTFADVAWQPLVAVFTYISVLQLALVIAELRRRKRDPEAALARILPLRAFLVYSGIVWLSILAFVAMDFTGFDGLIRWMPVILLMVPLAVYGVIQNPRRETATQKDFYRWLLKPT